MSIPSSKIIWTAAAIGARVGASADFVRDTLANMPNSPVKRLDRRFYALEDDLIDFFRNLPA
jgi:hypothetical protein